MPRIARVAAGGVVQHVLNPSNGRMKLFHKPRDYQAFVDLLGEALDRVPGISLPGWCRRITAVARPAGPAGRLDFAGQRAVGRG
jgi:hypothetical protein